MIIPKRSLIALIVIHLVACVFFFLNLETFPDIRYGQVLPLIITFGPLVFFVEVALVHKFSNSRK